jgi:hypothetical protein
MQFVTPYTMLVVGPTAAGKTHFLLRFLNYLDELVDAKFTDVCWCYSEWQPLYDTIKNPLVRFHKGLPNLDDFPPDQGSRLIICDDLMRECDGRIVDIFTRGSHHRSISIMFLTQNCFHQSKGSRDISLNTHYLCLFKNPRDAAQVTYLARQISPQNPKYITEAYADATSVGHGYLLLDFKQSTPDNLRVRTCIFPDDKVSYVYTPK